MPNADKGTAAGQPFRYFINDWAVVGLKDYQRGTCISPYGRLIMIGDVDDSEHHECATTVELRFGRDLRTFDPVNHPKTYLEGWIPVVQIHAEDGAVRYHVQLWTTPMPDVKDWSAAYDWPTEGENFLTWVTVDATNTGSSSAEGNFTIQQCGKGKYVEPRHPVPCLARPKEFAWTLAPGETERGVVWLPWWPVDVAPFEDEDADLWRERTIEYWRGLIAKGAKFEVPCEKTMQALRSSHVYQFIVLDGGLVKGGEGLYDAFWMRDGAYQILQFEEAGYLETAKRALEDYFKYQDEKKGGLFWAQHDQFDGNGQAPWAFWQYYKISGDREWLERAYPAMRRAADWTKRNRRTEPEPYKGLLPLAKGEGEGFDHGNLHHIVGADMWNLRGLFVTADAARVLGRNDEADELLKEANAYRADIDAAWKRCGKPHFPPSWEKYDDVVKARHSHWGNTETLWPTEIFDADDPRVDATIHEVQDLHCGGFREGLIRHTTSAELGEGQIRYPGPEADSTLAAYLTTYTTLADMIRGHHERVVENFYWYLLHTTASNQFGECINYKTRLSASDTVPHVTGCAMFAVMLRHMLIHERGDALHLLWAVPDWWLGDGKVIRIERAPTHFGEMALTVRGTAKGVEVELDAPGREKPARIVLHLPKSRPLVKPVAGVEVEVRPDQKERWDLPTILARYEKTAPKLENLVEYGGDIR